MSKTILTVDDSPSMRELVAMSLQDAGFAVVEAEDGQDALLKLRACQVQLVITDLNMPRLDGIGLIRALRAQESYRFIPILLLTTESEPHKKLEGKEAGATGWIVKPFRPEQLVAVVNRVIR